MNKLLKKKCGHCKVEQSLSEFYIKMSGEQAGQYESWCKNCKRERGRHYDKIRRLKNPTRWKKADWKRQLKRVFTPEQYDRMFFEQKGKCAICGTHQSKLKKSLSVDHNHTTGEIRGLLCSRCNFLVGYLECGYTKEAQEYLAKFDRENVSLCSIA